MYFLPCLNKDDDDDDDDAQTSLVAPPPPKKTLTFLAGEGGGKGTVDPILQNVHL